MVSVMKRIGDEVSDAKLLLKTQGKPVGVFALVGVALVVRQLLADDRVKKLTFAGSAEVGLMLKARVPKKKVTLELGGNAAVIVHEDADLDYSAKRCARRLLLRGSNLHFGAADLRTRGRV